MIKSADELREGGRNKHVIMSETKEIVKSMEQRMIAANRDGQLFIDFKVPKTYAAIPNDVDSTMLIVTSVLRELVEAKYNVKIVDLECAYLFTIRWGAELTIDDRRDLIMFMKKHMSDDND